MLDGAACGHYPDENPMDKIVIRERTPGCRHVHHFDAAGAALMSDRTLEAIRDHIDLEARVGGYYAEALAEAAIEDCYDAFAELLRTEPRNIAFVENATAGYAQVLQAIPFERGDLILTTENDYISNQIAFLAMQQRLGVRFERIPEDPEGGFDIAAAREMIADLLPRLVAITHVPTNAGTVQPVKALGNDCRNAGAWYLVDACQSLGQLDLDVGAIGCDFLTASTRKFLRGPRGVGILYASDRALDAGIGPMLPDMRGARWMSADHFELVPSAKRFENWEFAWSQVLGAGAAAREALAIGMPAIEARLKKAAAELRSRLDAIPGVRCMDRGREVGAIVTTTIEGVDMHAARDLLYQHDIMHSLSLREYGHLDFERKGIEWALRFSPHLYTDVADIEALISDIRTL